MTELPESGKPSFHGAARQTFGSGSLRPDDGTFNKIHVDKQEKLRERDHRERFPFDDVSSSSLGIVIKHVSHKPPGYNTRYVGKTPITHHTGIHDTVFRPSGSGTRRDDMWIHQGISPSRDNVFLGHDDIVMPEDMLVGGGNHEDSGAPAECDATCGAMEFFCSKSCSCIHSDLHCGRFFFNLEFERATIGKLLFSDGQIDCGPEAEDEDDCEITEDMVKKMKSDCESNTISRHVLCPNTYICIKEDWLCGKSISIFFLPIRYPLDYRWRRWLQRLYRRNSLRH